MTKAPDPADEERLQQVLGAAEQRYGTFFARLNIAVLLIDPADGRLVDSNSVARAYYGHTTDRFQQTSAPDAPAMSLEQAAAQIALANREHKTHFSFRHLREDGEVRDLEVYSGPIELLDRPLLYCILHDVTGRDAGSHPDADSDAHQRLVMDCAEDAIFVSDNDGHYLYANPAALRMVGYSLDELRAMSIGQLVAAADLPRLAEHLDATRKGERRLLDWRMKRKDGSVLLAEFSTLQLPDRRFLEIGRDVSQRRQTEDKLRLTARVFEEALEGIVIANANATMIDVNRAFTRLTGYAKEELIGQNPRILHSGHQSEEFYRDMWAAVLEKGMWQGEIWNRRKDGELFVTRVIIAAVGEDSIAGRHYIGFFSDVTARKRQQEAMEGLAYYDAVTGLPNRVLFADRMQQALLAVLRQGGIVAVCALDLDEFKPINDRYGHMAGDQVLASIAHRLQAAMRAQDTVARLGGDEFALLLTAVYSAQEVDAVLARVLQAVAKPCKLGNGETATVTASIGVALYPEGGGDFDTLMRHADQAMYIAKHKGRNRVHFYVAETDI